MVASSSHLCSLQSPVFSLPLCLSPPLPGVQPGTEASSGFPSPLLLPLLKRRSRQYRLHHRQCKCPQKLFASDIGDFENGIESMAESSDWCIPYRMTFPQQHGGSGEAWGVWGTRTPVYSFAHLPNAPSDQTQLAKIRARSNREQRCTKIKV